MQNFLVLGVLVLFIASILVGVLNNIVVNSNIDSLSSTEYPLPDDYINHVRGMESKELSKSIEPGEYVYQMQFGDSPLIGGRVRIQEDQTITRNLTIDHASRMYATADYQVVGSVLKYDNIKGDKYLLHSVGSPVYEDNNKMILELDGHLRIELEKQGTYPNYTGVVHIPDNRPLLTKILSLHPLNLLQKLLITLAIALMGYILFRINFKPDTPRKDGPDNIFKA